MRKPNRFYPYVGRQEGLENVTIPVPKVYFASLSGIIFDILGYFNKNKGILTQI